MATVMRSARFDVAARLSAEIERPATAMDLTILGDRCPVLAAHGQAVEAATLLTTLI
jgi:hypothetical protein